MVSCSPAKLSSFLIRLFEYEHFVTVTKERIVFDYPEYRKWRLDINLLTGEGSFDVKVSMGGWSINDRSHHSQWVTLEGCRINK